MLNTALQIVQAHPALIAALIPAAYLALAIRELFWAGRYRGRGERCR